MMGTLIGRALLALTLAVLFFVPVSRFGWLVWLAAFAIFFVALTHVVGEVRRARRLPLLVTALATMALFLGACANHARAFVRVHPQARAFAEEVQARCAQDGVCPAAAVVCTYPEAWACRSAGSLGVQLPLRYRLADDARSFSVTSSMGMDDATVFSGGVGVPLVRRAYLDGVDMNADTNADAGAPAAGAP